MLLPLAGLQVLIYTQERRTGTFMYTTGLSSLDEFSVCFWMKGVEDDDVCRKTRGKNSGDARNILI